MNALTARPAPSVLSADRVSAPAYSLDADGYFLREGRPFVPVGVNYWPSSCGLAMWRRWPVGEIEADLALTARLGLNTLRFFLLWPDFEPAPGEWSETAFGRLDRFLELGREAGLTLHPALFTGWMSGGLFWPAWKRGRNLFSDPELRLRSVAYARRCGEALRPHAGNLLAIDLGNELSALPEAAAAGPAEVAAWCEAVTDALRESCPDVLIVAGNDHSQVVGDCGWELGRQPGTDFYSMHAYPAPTWHPVATDGMLDPLCQSLLPFYTRVARAHGPTLVQEFGTLLTPGLEAPAAYLRAVLARCWEAGANGFLWWCLRDIDSLEFPYSHHGMERRLGLVDARGEIKPGLRPIIEWLARHAASQRPYPRAHDGGTAVYWPEIRAGGPAPVAGERAAAAATGSLAHYFFSRLVENTPRVVRAEALAGPAAPALLVVTVEHLPPAELNAVLSWLRAGGHLVWHNLNLLRAAPELLDALGLRVDDFRAALPARVSLGEAEWTFTRFPAGLRYGVEGAEPDFLRDRAGITLAARARVGLGRAVAVFASVEAEIGAVSARRAERDNWTGWYRALLAWGSLSPDLAA